MSGRAMPSTGTLMLNELDIQGTALRRNDNQTVSISKQCNQQTEISRWRHQMEAFSAFLALCVGNSLVTGEFPSQRPVTGGFDVFFDLQLNKWLSKQSWDWWFETPSRPLWRHYDLISMFLVWIGERQTPQKCLIQRKFSIRWALQTKCVGCELNF